MGNRPASPIEYFWYTFMHLWHYFIFYLLGLLLEPVQTYVLVVMYAGYGDNIEIAAIF